MEGNIMICIFRFFANLKLDCFYADYFYYEYLDKHFLVYIRAS